VIHADAMQGSKKSRKASKKDCIVDDDDVYVDPQSSGSCTSEEGNFEGNTYSSAKKTCTRASRGGATDPQSLYARVSTQKNHVFLKSYGNTNKLQNGWGMT
jgi:hypothetical protein